MESPKSFDCYNDCYVEAVTCKYVHVTRLWRVENFFYGVLCNKLFSIPIIGDENDTLTNELNSFLRSHRILNVERHLVTTTNSGLWCFCVEYVEGASINNARQGGKKIDYKEVLSKEEFAKFSFLRECRKALAAELGVPAYAVFVDAELAELSKTELENINKETMVKMEGFGEKRFENYGSKFVDFLKAKLNEKSGQPVSENS